MVKSGNFGELGNYINFKTKYDEYLADNSFFVCLSHDVDNIKKRHQYITRFIKNHSLNQLKSFLDEEEPFWNFEKIIKIENRYNVKSTFFFLCELSQSSIFDTIINNKESKRYNLNDEALKKQIKNLDSQGWEIGIHGSFNSYRNLDLLCQEKSRMEKILGHDVKGIRQHYLNLSIPKTWHLQKKCGFTYDASYGLNKKAGFKNNIYYPFNPLKTSFIVIPVTIMDTSLFASYKQDEIWPRCNEIIKESIANRSVLSVLWHQESFSEIDFPTYTEIYQQIIEKSIEAGARFVTLGELSNHLLH